PAPRRNTARGWRAPNDGRLARVRARARIGMTSYAEAHTYPPCDRQPTIGRPPSGGRGYRLTPPPAQTVAALARSREPSQEVEASGRRSSKKSCPTRSG